MRHRIVQAEGGEQGDPLMPLLFSLGIHDSLRAVKERMRPEDELFAYLDDVHVVSPPDRTRGVYNLVEAELLAGAGIRLNIGKTRTWSRGGTRPPDLDDLGEDAWDPEGIKILGTPIGSDDFVQRVLDRRLEDEAKLWTALTWVPDLQCAWQVLLQCAGPRCHHLLRTLPPSQSLEYAARHDEGMMQAMDNLLGGLTGGADEKEVAHHVASLPMRLGGLGLRSARRMAAGAYWSSWADALAMIHQRLPRVANSITEKLEGVVAARGCLTELREVADRLDRQGFVGRPGWGELKLGARPPPAHTVEPGEWAHGWQYHASSAEYNFREMVVLPQSSASHQAHLRSHSGGGSSNVLHGYPTSPEFTVEAALFRTLVLERLRLPLAVTEGRCECGDWVDSKGWHRAACPHSGRLRTRAAAPERTLARVLREAGATVRFNCLLREMNVAVRAEDERRIEVLASGLPLFHGAQLAVDITLRSALACNGEPRPGAARVNGSVCERARADKETKYAELLEGDRCRLVVVALETGGRWSSEAIQFVESLASSRAREEPPALAKPAFLAWRRRWARMISISCARAFATSLVAATRAMHAVAGTDGEAPDAVALFSEA